MRKRSVSQTRGTVTEPVTASMLDENAILAGLTASRRPSILDQGLLVTLPVRAPIYLAETPIDHVYFPIDCVLSVVTQMTDGRQIEVGTVGREGTSGIPLLFGSATSANESFCQVPGKALRIPASLFNSLVGDSTFRPSLDRYVQAYVNMLGQLAACNRLHSVNERCARWLLMSQDRVRADTIRLTHEFLAMMLGAQRSGVTIAAGMLQTAGLITYDHGVITILNRQGLEAASCECYDVARAQFGGLSHSVALEPSPNAS